MPHERGSIFMLDNALSGELSSAGVARVALNRGWGSVSVIRHLVFMKFSEAVPPEKRDKLMRDLDDLRNEIDGFEDFRCFQNVSPEKDFSHGLADLFWIDFRDVRARDAYLANETHKAIGARIMASLEGGAKGIFVCDLEL